MSKKTKEEIKKVGNYSVRFKTEYNKDTDEAIKLHITLAKNLRESIEKVCLSKTVPVEITLGQTNDGKTK